MILHEIYNFYVSNSFARLIKKAKQFRRLEKLLRHRNDDFSEIRRIKSSEKIC